MHLNYLDASYLFKWFFHQFLRVGGDDSKCAVCGINKARDLLLIFTISLYNISIFLYWNIIFSHMAKYKNLNDIFQ